MARCSQCKRTILFGGKREGELRFCNEPCRANFMLLNAVQQCPPELVASDAAAIHGGSCPICKGPGPVDVHLRHSVISLIAVTFWKNRQVVACRSCARKRQLLDTFVSATFGWWGFPHGLVMTPIQIGRNISAMLRGPDPARPSDRLAGVVRLDIARKVLADAKSAKGGASTRPSSEAIQDRMEATIR